MKLKTKKIDLSTGSNLIAIINKINANFLNLKPMSRILIKEKKITAIVEIDTESRYVKSGEIGLSQELFKIVNKKTINIIKANKPASVFYIKDKLLGKELNKEQINEIIQDVYNNNLADIELTYLISACFKSGLSKGEVVALTKAIIKNSEKLNLKEKIIADKHCIGGLAGNRTTMIVIPIIAAAGITTPKTSSRSITSPAGTSDVMEILAPVSHSKEEIKTIIKKTNACLVWGGALDLAPVDDKLIKIEEPLGINPEGIMLASIIAKKACVNATHILIDIPVGDETKITTRKKARDLKKKFIELGKKLNMKIKVAITNGSQPIGNGIGPALEAKDVLLVLQNIGPEDLKNKSIKLAGIILKMCGKPKKLARILLESGEAYKKMKEIIIAQGGNPNIQPEKIK